MGHPLMSSNCINFDKPNTCSYKTHRHIVRDLGRCFKTNYYFKLLTGINLFGWCEQLLDKLSATLAFHTGNIKAMYCSLKKADGLNTAKLPNQAKNTSATSNGENLRVVSYVCIRFSPTISQRKSQVMGQKHFCHQQRRKP